MLNEVSGKCVNAKAAGQLQVLFQSLFRTSVPIVTGECSFIDSDLSGDIQDHIKMGCRKAVDHDGMPKFCQEGVCSVGIRQLRGLISQIQRLFSVIFFSCFFSNIFFIVCALCFCLPASG